MFSEKDTDENNIKCYLYLTHLNLIINNKKDWLMKRLTLS